MLRAAKTARTDAQGSALLTRAQAEGFDTALDVPFTSDELGYYTAKEGASAPPAERLVTAIRVRLKLGISHVQRAGTPATS